MNNGTAGRHRRGLAPAPVCVGIGVTHDTLEMCISSMSVIFGYRNETFGIESLADGIVAWAPALIVLESAGGAEHEVACALQALRLPLAIVKPQQARDWLPDSATLPLDGKGARASLLAALADVLNRHPSGGRLVEPLSDPQLGHVQALVQRRRQLARMQIAEYQLLTLCHGSVRNGIVQTIAFLKHQIAVVDRHCARHVNTQRDAFARLLAHEVRPGRVARHVQVGAFIRNWRAK
ncbi:transposase [Burkholderia sola]|nr:transposase [Burkholderia cenocepacia]CAG2324845.1 transposase [Burkholderia cenocepacia]CAG2324863.1 transposase [Burkholderia cenocepacia]CAG2324864.1 transposase [Burkholderia cenocepacia]CAG2324908.1 transposase [Burkholderia cenocepacia]